MSHKAFRYLPQIEQVGLKLPRGALTKLADRDRQLEDYVSALHTSSGGGSVPQALLTMRNTVAQTYPGGYFTHRVTYNVTDAESFGTGITYDTSQFVVEIEENGWYLAVANMDFVIAGSVNGQKGHIRVEVSIGSSPRPVASNSTYADNEDTWIGASSKPFQVTDGYEVLQTIVSHDMFDGAAPMSIADSETGDTFLSVYRIGT